MPTAKVAIITGAARRVGAAVSLALAHAGYDVFLTCNRSSRQATSLARKIESLGRRAHVMSVDLQDSAAPQAIAAQVRRHYSRADLLVNNAAIYQSTPLDRLTRSDLQSHFHINAIAPTLLAQALAPLLSQHYRRGKPATAGRIINLLDAHILGQHRKNYLAYAMSKAALLESTLCLARELAPAVTVNGIAPGVVAWASDMKPADRKKYLQRVPLAVPGSPADVASAILFLATSAHYLTGEVLRVDGGRLLT